MALLKAISAGFLEGTALGTHKLLFSDVLMP